MSPVKEVAVNDRISPDVELAWDEFHTVVNMTSEELRAGLLTDASGEHALPADPDMRLSALGRRVVDLLRKRKVDLTDDDANVMRQVIDYVNERADAPPAAGAADDDWRHALMTVG